MSQVISWIAAVAEAEEDPEDFREKESQAESVNDSEEGLYPEQACSEAGSAPPYDDPLDRNPDLRAYRGRTAAMLMVYLRYSLETGRLPSVMGSEYFRTRVTCYSVVTFEDRVVFVHDMEVCLKRLGEFSRQVITRCVLQGHNRWDAARLLRCNEKTIRRHIPVALDELSEILLDVGLLKKLDSTDEKSCQGGKFDEFLVSDCDDGK